MAGTKLERTPGEPPRFNPQKLAQLEVRGLRNLWLGRKARGKEALVQMAQQQYGLNQASATQAIEHLVKAYGLSRNPVAKEQEYLRYYEILSRASGLGFDPQKATRIQMNADSHREWAGSILQRETTESYESSLIATIYNVPKESLREAAQVREDAFDYFRDYLTLTDPDVVMDENNGDSKELLQKTLTGLTKYYELLGVAVGQHSLQVT